MAGTAPTELDFISTAHTLKKVTASEWAGECPRCGGSDRFHVHAIRPFPSWLWMCRVCSPEWRWLDELNPSLKRPLTDEQKREFAEERARLEQARAAELDKRVHEFTAAEIWAAAYRRMNADNREWWRSRGVPDEWQNYLQLGYIADKTIYAGDNFYHTPAYTIPYLRQQKAPPVTMQYRLVDPPDPKDKYRFESGLPAAWYMARLQPLADEVVICEGAIKSIVTAVYGGLREDVSILAVPGKTSWAGIVEHVKPCGRVWVVLDPDGEQPAANLCRKIGPAARLVTIPEKIDDAILAGMTPDDLKVFFRYARKE